MSCSMLQAGHRILHVPDALVMHHGFCLWEQGGRLYVHRGYLALGAIHMKYLRTGTTLCTLYALLHLTLSESIYWKNLCFLRWKHRLGGWDFLFYLQG